MQTEDNIKLDKRLLGLQLKLGGYLSNTNIKLENVEKRHVQLITDITELEKRVRSIETNLDKIIIKSVGYVLTIFTGLASFVYIIFNIIKMSIK